MKKFIKQIFFSHFNRHYSFKNFDPFCGVEKAKAPPSSWYKNSDFLQLEKQFVFMKNFIPFGRCDQLNNPGSYFTFNLLNEPFGK